MEVSYSTNSKGYLATPTTPNGAGIIVIHEFWGLNKQIKNEADKMAAAGFTVLAIDLYEGSVAQNVDEARKLKEGVKNDETIANLKDAISYLEKSGINRKKTAIWGFCFGGGVAFKAATNGVTAGAYIVYYGRVTDDQAVLAKIQSPLLGIFGGKDESIPQNLVERFHKTLHDLNKPHEVYIYPEAGHAFANEERERYHESSTKDAWSHTIMFLNKYLL